MKTRDKVNLKAKMSVFVVYKSKDQIPTLTRRTIRAFDLYSPDVAFNGESDRYFTDNLCYYGYSIYLFSDYNNALVFWKKLLRKMIKDDRAVVNRLHYRILQMQEECQRTSHTKNELVYKKEG